MVDCWFMADPHLGHAKCITEFKRWDGSPLRDFRDIDHMHEEMIARWNARVKPQDHAYMMGDIVIKPGFLKLLPQFNGHLRLLRGNHDIFKTRQYLPYFEEIGAVRVMDGVCFSHFPIHPSCMGRYLGNAHGHLHHQKEQLGPQYLNLSCEMTGYMPRHLEEVKRYFADAVVDGRSPNS